MIAHAMSSPRGALRLSCCLTFQQFADKQLEKAKQLISLRKREDVEAALTPLDCALELRPDWEAALELKARVLLYLKRYKDVVDMLHEYVPSLQSLSPSTSSTLSPSSSSHERPATACRIASGPPDSPTSSSSKEKARLLPEFSGSLSRDDIFLFSPLKHCFSIANLGHKLSISLSRSLSASRLSLMKAERQQQWRYPVLGQACFYLGMLEDAMILLQKGKRSASDISRKQSNGMREDNFCTDASIRSTGMARSVSLSEPELVLHMLGNVKFLLRRRAAAMAALEAGLYAESARHFSKIIDGRKGSTPQGFIADCYLHRAITYQATGRVVDAISDCNRCLVLSPQCSIQALSVRASLYEMVRCYSDCMLDLQQLKMIYEASLRYQSMLPELGSAAAPTCTWTMWQPHISYIDFAGGLEYINSKITSTRQRLSSGGALDAHTILDMPRNCTMQDVERAYLLISLKHRVDKAAQFVERRDFVGLHDQRDPAMVKEEAQAAALRLSQLIHKAYTKLLSSIAEAETEKRKEMSVCGGLEDEADGQLRFIRRGKGGSRGRDMFPERGGRRDNCTSLREKIGGPDESCGALREKIGGERQRIEECTASVGMNGKDGVDSLMGSLDGEVSTKRAAITDKEEEQDGCDFCQPFGEFSSSTLAIALSQALSTDLPVSSITWPHDWTLAHQQSQPLPVP